MPASYEGAKEAIRTRLAAGWHTTRITYQNETPAAPWPPKDGNGDLAPWVNLEVIGSGSHIVGQGVPGNQLWLYPGLIQVHVFAPVGSGDQLAGTYAGTIGEIFRAAKFYDDVTPGAYVRCGLGAGPAPHTDGGGTGSDDGNWFRVTMTCGFEYWHRG